VDTALAQKLEELGARMSHLQELFETQVHPPGFLRDGGRLWRPQSTMLVVPAATVVRVFPEPSVQTAYLTIAGDIENTVPVAIGSSQLAIAAATAPRAVMGFVGIGRIAQFLTTEPGELVDTGQFRAGHQATVTQNMHITIWTSNDISDRFR
jgi:hypothetical protein